LAGTFGELENFVRSHEVSAGLAGIFAEGAVAAIVAAESGQGDEDLFRIGDDIALALGAELGCGAKEVAEGRLRRQ